MYDEEHTKEKNGRRLFKGPFIDTIAKAVLTGIFVLSLLINVILIIIIAVMGATAAGRDRDRMATGYRKIYTERSSLFQRDNTADEIAVLRISGIITEYDTRDSMFGNIENPLTGVRNRLNIIRSDKNIKGVLLVIDSPGGGVTASDVLYNTIVRFKEETGIPVVTLMKQVAASGGYYVAAASDYIVAYPTAITGSIGVIMYNFNFTGLMDKYGVEYVAVKTGEHKDFSSPFKPVDEEELAWMQDIVDKMLDRFIDAVSQGRENLTREEVRNLANGKIYIAKDALENGLIDAIGYFEDAVNALSERAGIVTPSIVEYRRERPFRDIIGRVALSLSKSFLHEGIFQNIPVHPYQLFYLWDSAPSIR